MVPKFKIEQVAKVLLKFSIGKYLIIGNFNTYHYACGSRCFDSMKRETFCDLAYASPSVSAGCTFTLLDNPMSSNHYPVQLSVVWKSNQNSSPHHNSRISSLGVDSISDCLSDINFKKMDWIQFKELYESIFFFFVRILILH